MSRLFPTHHQSHPRIISNRLTPAFAYSIPQNIHGLIVLAIAQSHSAHNIGYAMWVGYWRDLADVALQERDATCRVSTAFLSSIPIPNFVNKSLTLPKAIRNNHSYNE